MVEIAEVGDTRQQDAGVRHQAAPAASRTQNRLKVLECLPRTA